MYFAKATIWYANGWKYYTKSGYENAAGNFKSLDSVDVKGWSFLVTGGSSGLGKETASQLSKKAGTSTHIVCRNKENGEAAMSELVKHAHPESKVFLHLADLSDPKSAIELAKKIISEGTNINVLINNAGVLNNKLTLTPQGLESSFSLNVVGTYLLTTHLIEHLVKSSSYICKPRVITVSSGGMLTQDLNYDDPSFVKSKFDGVGAYAQHKRQQVVLTDIWAEKFPDVHFSSMHPGWVETEGVKKSLPKFYERNKNNLRTVLQGADTIIWLAISPDALNYKSGEFFFDRAVAKRFVISSAKRYGHYIEQKFINNLEAIIKKLVKSNDEA